MNSDRLDKPVMAGPYGNAAVADSGVTLASAAIATVVDLVRLPAGARILDAKLTHGALNTDTTLMLGYRYEGGEGTDDPDALLPAASSASAGRRDSAVAPLSGFAGPVTITATVGGAAATGRIDVVVLFEDEGNL
jgi:hypothetical protein